MNKLKPKQRVATTSTLPGYDITIHWGILSIADRIRVCMASIFGCNQEWDSAGVDFNIKEKTKLK